MTQHTRVAAHGVVPAVPILSFSGGAKSFAGLPAIRDVDLSIERGEFIALLGPSGCGKSTLLNLTAGIFKPTQGEVLYGGRPVDALNLRTGYMTQADHLLPWRSVEANIAVPLEIRGDSRAAIAERVRGLIELVGLTGFERHYLPQISGGMRKRVALARLLAYDPETLLMDEPFAALDAQLRVAMQDQLLTLSRDLKKTVLFVTHDIDEAVALADRIVVFTQRPGTILRILDSPLPKWRNLRELRRNADYQRITADLWDLMSPMIDAREEVRP